jgi:hypothetical protein
MTWFSITPFIILAIVLFPVIGYLVYHRIRDVKKVKVETHNKIDLILENTLAHDAYLRQSDVQNKQILTEIKETTSGTSTRLMDVINRLINGRGKNE